MDKATMRNNMATIVSLMCDELTDQELAVLNTVAQLDGNPHGQLFDYDKVKGLFTEGGMRMHDETKQALARVVIARLG